MTNLILTLLGFVFGGGTLGFIQFMVNRADKKKADKQENEMGKMNKRLDKSELDLTRLQLLALIKWFPESTQETMKCAEYYFRVLKGDWFMTSMFCKWLVANKIAKPEWFDETN